MSDKKIYYKGFHKGLTCRGFQYKEGEWMHVSDNAELCKEGVHACEAPIDCFSYYNPAESEFHAVELDGVSEKREIDTKVVATDIKVLEKLSIKDLVDAQIEFVKSKSVRSESSAGDYAANSSTGDGSANSSTGDYAANSSTGDYAANSSTGYYAANSSTGDGSANISTGYYAANSSTGDWSANSSTGDGSANSSTGYRSANISTGYYAANSSTGDGSANSSTGDGSANSSTGDGSANSSTGYRSANSSTGDGSANSSTGDGSANSSTGDGSANSSTGYGSVNVGWGIKNKCKGAVGNYLVLSEWGEWDGNKYPLLCAKMAVVDGETIKADTWYMLKNGEFVEVSN